MKPYTDLCQSKKLAKILPIDTADGFYEAQLNPKTEDWEYVLIAGNQWASPEVVVPTWSLTALLDVFPCSKESPIVNLTRGGWIPTTSNFTRLWFATWEDENKSIFYSCNGINPVDAVVRLILKLHKQELL